MNISEVMQAVEKLSHVDPDQRAELLLMLPPDIAFLAFEQLEAGHQHELLEHLTDAQVEHLIEQLDPDDRVRLFEELSPDDAQNLHSRLSRHEQTLTDKLLQHAPESAGRIMTPEFLTLDAKMSAGEALEAIRQGGSEVGTVTTLPVTDEVGRLIGVVALEHLVMSDEGERVAELMDDSPPSVTVDEDQEVVARMIRDADLLAVPVVDAHNRLLGLVTVDDAMDVAHFEEAEDSARAGATEPLGRPYLSVSILQLLRSRVFWLMLLAVAAVLTVNVLSVFEGTLEQVVSLSLFIPLLIGVGGNTGAQSATTIVRAVATKEIRFENALRILLREGEVGILLGLALGLVGFIPIWVFFGVEFAIVISLSLLAICTLATLVGSLMPLVADRLGIDPAVVSAPFVTTIVDTTGLIVYFLIARAVKRQRGLVPRWRTLWRPNAVCQHTARRPGLVSGGECFPRGAKAQQPRGQAPHLLRG
jgi:magnesium transporter